MVQVLQNRLKCDQDREDGEIRTYFDYMIDEVRMIDEDKGGLSQKWHSIETSHVASLFQLWAHRLVHTVYSRCAITVLHEACSTIPLYILVLCVPWCHSFNFSFNFKYTLCYRFRLGPGVKTAIISMKAVFNTTAIWCIFSMDLHLSSDNMQVMNNGILLARK